MSGFWFPPDDFASEPQQFSGSAHSVSGEKPEDDAAEKVRKVAEEIARKPLPKQPKRRIGFL